MGSPSPYRPTQEERGLEAPAGRPKRLHKQPPTGEPGAPTTGETAQSPPQSIAFGPCSVSVSAQVYTDQFNDGPGSVRPLNLAELSARRIPPTRPAPHQDLLVFESTGDTGRGPRVPGWLLQASANIDERCPPGTAERSYLFGFIQTVDTLSWEVRYLGLPNPFTMSVARARDAHTDAARVAPWMNAVGALDGPVDPFSPSGPARLGDSPMAYIGVWGHRTDARNPLRSVRLRGRFCIWLVLRPQAANAATPSSYGFLRYRTIEVDRSWTTTDSDPTMALSYNAAGGQRMVAEGPGVGNYVPVLNGATANQQLAESRRAWTLPGQGR